MNCTRDEFEKKVWTQHPHKFSIVEEAYGLIITVFMLDTMGEAQLSYADKHRIASHIWADGYVVKDTNGLFIQPPILNHINANIPTTTFNIPSHGGYNKSDIYIPDAYSSDAQKSLKCECGAHSVGSDKHYSWCPNKENA